MLPEGLIRDRVERLAQKIYKDYISQGVKELDLVVIMNSAFKFFNDLLHYLNL